MKIDIPNIKVNRGNCQTVIKKLTSGQMNKALLTHEDWRLLCVYGVMPPIFIDKFFDELDLTIAIKYQRIPEHLLDKYSDKFDWKDVCIHQKMSEEFMRSHDNLLEWKEVYYCQDISDEFYNDYISHFKYYRNKSLNK